MRWEYPIWKHMYTQHHEVDWTILAQTEATWEKHMHAIVENHAERDGGNIF